MDTILKPMTILKDKQMWLALSKPPCLSDRQLITPSDHSNIVYAVNCSLQRDKASYNKTKLESLPRIIYSHDSRIRQEFSLISVQLYYQAGFINFMPEFHSVYLISYDEKRCRNAFENYCHESYLKHCIFANELE